MGRTRSAAAFVTAGALLLGGCAGAANTAGSTAPDPVASSIPSSPTAGAAQVRRLDPADFEAQSAGRLVINVHIPDEGSLPGTELDLPYDEVSARSADLPADRATKLAIYCMTDHMSGIAGQELLRLRYTDIIELDGGMIAWQASGRRLLPSSS